MKNKKGQVWYAKCDDGTYDITVFDNRGNLRGNYNYGNYAIMRKEYKGYEFVKLDKEPTC